ncbi:MAG TPA: hypothetical protein VEI07_23205, partial [Planctomycetaceae bacterium]|nr:hypothetical protein [Planctomycetaceae bacterium]
TLSVLEKIFTRDPGLSHRPCASESKDLTLALQDVQMQILNLQELYLFRRACHPRINLLDGVVVSMTPSQIERNPTFLSRS